MGVMGRWNPFAIEQWGQGGQIALLSTEFFHIFFLQSFFSQAQSPSILKTSSPVMKCNNVCKHDCEKQPLSLNSDIIMMS